MINFLDNLLNKMGIWFGIIFKITIPAILFYYPFKMIMLAGVLLASILGIDMGVFGQNSQMIASFLFIIFVTTTSLSCCLNQFNNSTSFISFILFYEGSQIFNICICKFFLYCSYFFYFYIFVHIVRF